jgi:nicotinate-nucleotide pyrophosphorylase (carboxylating)
LTRPGATLRPSPDFFSHPDVAEVVAAALREDLGAGDITTRATVPPELHGEGVLVAREPCVVAGLPLVAMVYRQLGSESGAVVVETGVSEGQPARRGAEIARLRGPLATLLIGERVALNFVQSLSGTATLTRRFVDAVAGTGAMILDTRKTAPGLRLLQRYAVRAGGGRNHRFGLGDGVLIKDNHIAACGSVREAVERARASAPHGLRIEIECETLAQVDEALAAGADVLLLDNMTPRGVERARRRISGRARIEVSGGITLENVRRYAASGAELISVGRLTHSAPAVDIALDLVERRAPRPRQKR